MRTFDTAILSLNKKVKRFIIKNQISVREIDKTKVSWAGYCFITSIDKEIIINNKQPIHIKTMVLLHELGHYFDEEYINCMKIGLVKNENYELTADKYIYTFCKKYCSLLDLYLLHNLINACSKQEIIFSKLQTKIIYFCKRLKII